MKNTNNWIYLLICVFAIAIVVLAALVLNKVNKKNKEDKTTPISPSRAMKNMNVGMDIYVDPDTLGANKQSKEWISDCNNQLKKVAGFSPNTLYYCNGRLVDATSDEVCMGPAAIVPDTPNEVEECQYLGSCTRPINAANVNDGKGGGLAHYLCATKATAMNYPIATTNCSEVTKGKECKDFSAKYDFPTGVGFCQ